MSVGDRGNPERLEKGYQKSESWLTHRSEDEVYDVFEELETLIPTQTDPEKFKIEYTETDHPHLNEVNIEYSGDWQNYDVITGKLQHKTKASRDFKKQELVHLHGFLDLMANEVDESMAAEINRPGYHELGVRPTDIHEGSRQHERAVKTLAEEVLPSEGWPIYHRATYQEDSNVHVDEEILEEVSEDFPDTFQ